MKQYRFEDEKTGEILGFDRAENIKELIKRHDLASKEKMNVRIIETGEE